MKSNAGTEVSMDYWTEVSYIARQQGGHYQRRRFRHDMTWKQCMAWIAKRLKPKPPKPESDGAE